ncbi:MAG: response regulator [Chloroflexota bacterium]
MTIHRILLIEDEAELSHWLSEDFRKRDYEVLIATSQADAIRVCRKILPQLIVRNVSVPTYSVEEDTITSALRLTTRISHIPVLFLTPFDSTHWNTNVLVENFGIIDAYVTKPFDIEELHLRIEVMIKQTHRKWEIVDGLPSTTLIREYLHQLLYGHGLPEWTYLDLEIHSLANLETHYGVAEKEALLHYLALLIGETLDTYGTSEDFVGYPREGSFVIITFTPNAEILEARIVEDFTKYISQFAPIQLGISSGHVSSKLDNLESVDGIISLARKRHTMAE